MRHHSTKRKFGLEKDQRNALVKSLLRSLVLEEHIQTNLAKAKEIRPLIEKLITKGKAANLASYRALISKVGEEAANKIQKTLSPKYKERKGGYTRIVKLGQRAKDASEMAVIEFV